MLRPRQLFPLGHGLRPLPRHDRTLLPGGAWHPGRNGFLDRGAGLAHARLALAHFAPEPVKHERVLGGILLRDAAKVYGTLARLAVGVTVDPQFLNMQV